MQSTENPKPSVEDRDIRSHYVTSVFSRVFTVYLALSTSKTLRSLAEVSPMRKASENFKLLDNACVLAKDAITYTGYTSGSREDRRRASSLVASSLR